MKSVRQRLMSVRQRLYVSSPTSKILCEIDLKCIYNLPKEDNVTFDPRWIVWFGLKMFVSLSPISLSPSLSLSHAIDGLFGQTLKPGIRNPESGIRNPESGITGHCFTNTESKNYPKHSYIKDTTHFINFIENTPLPDGAVLATLDVCSLYTNIPQEEGIEVVCQYYQEDYQSKTPIPKQSLGDLMRLILKENSFKFNDKHYLQRTE